MLKNNKSVFQKFRKTIEKIESHFFLQFYFKFSKTCTLRKITFHSSTDNRRFKVSRSTYSLKRPSNNQRNKSHDTFYERIKENYSEQIGEQQIFTLMQTIELTLLLLNLIFLIVKDKQEKEGNPAKYTT